MNHTFSRVKTLQVKISEFNVNDNKFSLNYLYTLSLKTASTASSAKYSLSWERIFELRVVIAIFMRSVLNLSAEEEGKGYCHEIDEHHGIFLRESMRCKRK
jgi:hypothetical protein